MARRLRFPRLILASLAAFAWACGGAGETPTDVGSPVHLTVVLQTVPSNVIQKAKLLFDGRDVVTLEPPGGARQITLEGTANGVRRGSHSMKVVILQQASTPSGYTAGGAVVTQDESSTSLRFRVCWPREEPRVPNQPLSMFMTRHLRFSFCRKSEAEVAKLVAGPNVYICDSCVRIATAIIEQSGPSQTASSASRPAWKRLFDRLLSRRVAANHS